MASIPNTFPISLRSWPSKSADATDLPTLFQRIQSERGGFLNISEDSLREEIAKEESGVVVEDESEDEEDKGAEEVKARAAARQELLQQITTAHHTALNSLNFVSLLLSKTNPQVASQTISPELRDLVPLGTLGATRATEAWVTKERKEDNKIVARGWKARDVDKTIDSILASATRLESEIQKETVYWEEILSLNDHGWSVCKVPRRKGLMGVRLGSSEATPVLRSQSLAVLSRTDTGSLQLNHDPTTASPKTLRVRIRVNDEITGTSHISAPLPKDAGISALLLQTRNTLFAVELWHELNRESRTLGGFDIHAHGDTLLFPISGTQMAILDLFPLSEYTLSPPQQDDAQAQGLALAFNLLLSYSHRQSLRRRSQPPKPKPNPKRVGQSGPPLNKQPIFAESPTLLRPILTLLNHQSSLTKIHTLFHLLTSVLNKASVSSLSSTFKITTNHANLPPLFSQAERTIAKLTNYLSDVVTFTILPSTELKIMLRTSQTNIPTTIYSLSMAPESTPLLQICPPPVMVLNFEQVEEYVHFVTAAAVAYTFTIGASSTPTPAEKEDETIAEDDAAGKTDRETGVEARDLISQKETSPKQEVDKAMDGWIQTHHPTTLKYSSRSAANDKLLTFSLLKLTEEWASKSTSTSTSNPAIDNKQSESSSKQGLKLRLTHLFNSEFEMGGHKALSDPSALTELVEQKLAGGVGREGGDEKIGGREGEGVYEWVVWDTNGEGDVAGEGLKDGEGGVVRPLSDVVEEAGVGKRRNTEA